MTAIPIIPFGKRHIGPEHPTVIIAEIGINHEGSVDTCAKMIEQAALSGADAIKLQTVNPEENYAPGTESHKLFKSAWLTLEKTAKMFEHARTLGVEPFTTAGDFRTLASVDALNPAAHKISSGLLTNLPLIREAALTGRTLLMSTGMNDLKAIDAAVCMARNKKNHSIGLFQCTSLYPAPPETLNLRVIGALTDQYRLPCGFSDHSEGIDAPAHAVAAGAQMIEKHFTLNRRRPSFDHHLSLEPKEFKTMVSKVRSLEVILGSSEKKLLDKEKENARRFHRCIVARKNLVAGQKILEDDLGIMRVQPGCQGLPPSAFDETIGKHIKKDLLKYTPIKSVDINKNSKC